VSTNHNGRRKTLGPQAARLVTTLYERGRTIFALAEVEEITGLAPAPARSFVHKLAAGGVVVRLRPGLFALVPFELGRERQYLGDPYVVARELAGAKDYYVSHAGPDDRRSSTIDIPPEVARRSRPRRCASGLRWATRDNRCEPR
jgi:hypothetical protein